MRTSSYGRIVFGGSAVLFGVTALIWHDADTWQTLRHLWSLPSGILVGECLMGAQIAGGMGIQYRGTVRWAAAVLGVVYLLFSLACVPPVLAAPTVYVHYESFTEQFSLLCGAMALYAATAHSTTGAGALGRLARLGMGACAGSFALAQMFYLRYTADLVPRWIPPSRMFWAVFTTVAFGLAAIAILLNRRARLAAGLMTLMLTLFGLLVWVPRLVARPGAHSNWSEFCATFLIAGAAWMVADGRPF